MNNPRLATVQQCKELVERLKMKQCELARELHVDAAVISRAFSTTHPQVSDNTYIKIMKWLVEHEDEQKDDVRQQSGSEQEAPVPHLVRIKKKKKKIASRPKECRSSEGEECGRKQRTALLVPNARGRKQTGSALTTDSESSHTEDDCASDAEQLQDVPQLYESDESSQSEENSMVGRPRMVLPTRRRKVLKRVSQCDMRERESSQTSDAQTDDEEGSRCPPFLSDLARELYLVPSQLTLDQEGAHARLGRLERDGIGGSGARRRSHHTDTGRSGFVYIMGYDVECRYKIGRSRQAVNSRLMNMRTDNPTLRVVATFSVTDCIAVEQLAQSMLEHVRMMEGPGKEWFACTLAEALVAVSSAVCQHRRREGCE